MKNENRGMYWKEGKTSLYIKLTAMYNHDFDQIAVC